MLGWIKRKLKVIKTSQEFTRQCEQLLNDFNGKRIENYLEVEMLHPETGNRYLFTIQRKEGMSPGQKNAKLVELISEAAPLAWVHHNDMDAASNWEKKAVQLIK